MTGYPKLLGTYTREEWYAAVKEAQKNAFPDPILTKFRARIHNQDDDVFAIACGKRGSTKSGSMISLGLQIDTDVFRRPRFFLDEHYIPKDFKLAPTERLPRVIFLPSQLMDMLGNFMQYPKGTAILWDEAGVEGDARDFAKQKNKLLKRTMQTMRSLNWFMMLTAVTIKDFDVAFERNAGFVFNCKGKIMLNTPNGPQPYGRAKVQEIEVNPKTGERYYPYLRYKDNDDRQLKILNGFYYIKKPPAYVEEPYKRYKQLFQTKLYRAYAKELNDVDSIELGGKKFDEVTALNNLVDDVKNNASAYFDFKKKKFVPEVIFADRTLEFPETGRAIFARKAAQLLNFMYSKGQIRGLGKLEDVIEKKRRNPIKRG